MIKCLCVGLGGAVGAMLRYLIGLVPVGASNGFPVKTLLINILGAFVIGVLAVLGEKHSASAASGTDAKDRRLRWLYNIFHICTRDQPAVPERKLWTGDRVCVRQCYFEHCGGAVRVHVAVLSRADAMQRKGRA